MGDLFASGRIADLILGIVAIEAVMIAALWRRTSRRGGPGGLLLTVASGALLILALRSSMAGDAWPWIAAFLAGALVAHALDLRHRWRS